MKGNFGRVVAGGILATIAMSLMAFMAPMMGLPEMNAPDMLAGMLHIPVAGGWIMHLMIGVIFAMAYGWLFMGWLSKIQGKAWKGLIFGVAVFVFAQAMMAIMRAMMPAPDMAGSMMLLIIGSLAGHMVYGLVVGLVVTEKKLSLSMA